ncbi:MAG: redoxin domain-containing protein [Gemmatimonadetes bacterium]|nr:redoxin domain-containing protein [Gemmatimonadota bacterium]MBK7835403.1 redoxin domain-containing protein [Gemmatimonadota bacterium]MBK9406746.1 redoxin domain-containing protein [Gemmatimonadota bacterium]
MTSSTTLRVPAVGELAPDISLPSTSGEVVTLSSFRGQQSVLLAFFPLAFTAVCTTEMCSFRDDYADFSDKDVTVFPVSVDATPSQREFKAKYEMPVDLLSDFKREAATAYGVLIPEKFFANRAYFLIDKAGVIRWAHVEAHPGQRRENAEILVEIAKLG